MSVSINSPLHPPLSTPPRQVLGHNASIFSVDQFVLLYLATLMSMLLSDLLNKWLRDLYEIVGLLLHTLTSVREGGVRERGRGVGRGGRGLFAHPVAQGLALSRVMLFPE